MKKTVRIEATFLKKIGFYISDALGRSNRGFILNNSLTL
jgi:hypothetical protein